MTINNALRIFVTKYPGQIPIGYWEQDGNIIINTKNIDNFAGSAQFVITPDGEVYGTTPVQFNLSLDTMKKINRRK